MYIVENTNRTIDKRTTGRHHVSYYVSGDRTLKMHRTEPCFKIELCVVLALYFLCIFTDIGTVHIGKEQCRHNA